MKRTLYVALSLCTCQTALSQGVVTDGDSSYQFFNSSITPGLSNFTAGSPAGDELAWSWWWYRSSNDPDPRERAFNPRPATQTFDGSTAVLADTESLGLDWVQTWTVIDGAEDAATLVGTISVTNISLAPITIDLFNITNTDLGNGLSGDTADLTEPGLVTLGDRFSDASGFFAYDSGAVDQVAAAGPVSLRDLLSDNDTDDFESGGFPFNELTDFGIGLQFSSVELGVGESASYSVSFGIGQVPAPGATAVLIPLGLVAGRRRRNS